MPGNNTANWFGPVGRGSPSAVLAALVLTLGLHWLAAQHADVWLGMEARERSGQDERTLSVVIEPPENSFFLEANPAVPSNEPDTTEAFAARDQQAAQEDEETLDQSPVPLRDSEYESQTILERGSEASEPLPPGIYGLGESGAGDPAEVPFEAFLPEARVAVGQDDPEITDGEGLRLPEVAREAAPEDREAIRVIDLREVTQASGQSQVDDRPAGTVRPQPMPRPRLSPDVLQAPLRGSATGARQVGSLAVSTRLSEFGSYLQRMLETIQTEWHRLASEVNLTSADTYARVRISFRVDTEGRVRGARIVETSAGAIGSAICLDAIMARSPFGEWTEAMRKSLGEDTEVTITFHYR